jgi:hypothetical protein
MISLVDIGAGLWTYAHTTIPGREQFGGWWNDLDMLEVCPPKHLHCACFPCPMTHLINTQIAPGSSASHIRHRATDTIAYAHAQHTLFHISQIGNGCSAPSALIHTHTSCLRTHVTDWQRWQRTRRVQLHDERCGSRALQSSLFDVDHHEGVSVTLLVYC